jgi:hypothetical protein
MPHSSNDFWAAIEPVANRKFYGIGEKTPRQFDKIAKVGSDDEPQTSFVEYGGVNATLQLKTENAAVQQRTTSQGPVKTWNTITMAGAATISMEAAKDVKNRYPKLSQATGLLGEAAHVTPELMFALFMDRAFDSNYPATPDAVEMCGVHTLPDGTTTFQNELATPAALDETSAEDVKVALRSTLGQSGNIRPLMVEKWIVPSAYANIVEKLARTKQSTGNANNDVSVISGTDYQVFDYLGSSTRWFAETNASDKENGLFWDWIEKTQFITDQVPIMLQKVFIAYFRARYGIKDWRHIYGVAAT